MATIWHHLHHLAPTGYYLVLFGLIWNFLASYGYHLAPFGSIWHKTLLFKKNFSYITICHHLLPSGITLKHLALATI
jgi:hypothetical protein